MITINGDVYITNYGQTLDELVGADLPVYQFKDDDEDFEDDECESDCDGDCNNCEYGKLDDEEEFDIDEIVGELTSIYADKLNEDCSCDECTKEILRDLIRDFINFL